MPGAVREGDSTVGVCSVGAPCCSHGRSGTCHASTNVYINNKQAVKVGDAGDPHCPHGGTFLTTGGSTSVFVNGKAINMIGDPTPCQVCGIAGNIITGSENVIVGG